MFLGNNDYSENEFPVFYLNYLPYLKITSTSSVTALIIIVIQISSQGEKLAWISSLTYKSHRSKESPVTYQERKPFHILSVN